MPHGSAKKKKKKKERKVSFNTVHLDSQSVWEKLWKPTNSAPSFLNPTHKPVREDHKMLLKFSCSCLTSDILLFAIMIEFPTTYLYCFTRTTIILNLKAIRSLHLPRSQKRDTRQLKRCHQIPTYWSFPKTRLRIIKTTNDRVPAMYPVLTNPYVCILEW